jgi:UDP-N-acetylglucosamine transferase subunit ALG13
MIFVTVGTNEARFDRLLHAFVELAIDEEAVIQHGHSSPIHPPSGKLVDFLSFDEMVETIGRARVVVTHAGVGSVMVALANGKRPVVLPRLRAFGEAVDDHQQQLGRRFAEAELVTLVESTEQLGAAIMRAAARPKVLTASNSLAADLRDYLEDAMAPALGTAPV